VQGSFDLANLRENTKFEGIRVKRRVEMQKKSVKEEKSLATSPGEGIIPAPATSAFLEG
jgi:hypothetical protein